MGLVCTSQTHEMLRCTWALLLAKARHYKTSKNALDIHKTTKYVAVSCIEVEDYLLCISIASLGSKCHITELPVSKWKNWSYFQPWGCFHWKPFQFSRCSTQLLTSMLLPLLLAPLSSSFEAVTSAEQRNQKIIIHLPVTELHALFPLWSRHTWLHWKALIIH